MRMKPIEGLRAPNVGYMFYIWEIVLLLLAIAIPFVSWFIWQSDDMVARSGSLVVFFSVLSEFLLLNKANVKHIRNAQRVESGQEPLKFSTPAKNIGYVSLFVALLGTVLWGYGDLFI